MPDQIKDIKDTLRAFGVDTVLLSAVRAMPIWSNFQHELLTSIAAISGVPTDCGDTVIML